MEQVGQVWEHQFFQLPVGCELNGSIWVAVGEGTANTIATSPDGINWTGRGKTMFSTRGYRVAWNGTMFVAAGLGANTLAYSYDGINWVGLGATMFSSWSKDVAWNGTVWVATGSGANSIAYSYNGIDWTGLGKSIFSTFGEGIAWNGSYWLAVGFGAANSKGTSPDGINWTGGGTGTFTEGLGVVWSGTQWVVMGNGGNSIATSPDGTTWTGQGATFNGNGQQVAWNGTMFVAVGIGTNNTIATSNNGTAWTGQGVTVFSTNGYGIASSNSPTLTPPVGNTSTSKIQAWQTSSGGTLAVVDGTGSFGIGTTSPGSAKLRIQGSDNTTNGFALITGGSTSTGLVVRNDGKVGIGTLSPTEALTIRGNLQFASGGNRIINIASNAVGAGNALSIYGGNAGSGNTNGGDLVVSGGTKSGSGVTGKVIIKPQVSNDSTSIFQIQNAAGTSLFNADTTNGNITVDGTTTPVGGNVLTVKGGQTAGQTFIEQVGFIQVQF